MAKRGMTYAESGVDIDAGDSMASMIRRSMARTYGPRVIDNPGGFAGLFRLDYNEQLFRRNYREPVLAACTDGVGSKVKLAIQLGIYDTVGQDCVAMNVNDLIVQGAEPLFFLDYIGTNKLDPDRMTQIVKGVASACQQADCALLGGETAELPDLYARGDFDLAGFTVGVAEKNKLIDGSRVQRGDVVLGLGSNGIHSNGYSLVRAIVKQKRLKLDKTYPELETDQPLGRVLLEPTRLYVRPVISVLHYYIRYKPVSAMAHITGGGLPGNLNRALPDDLDAKIHRKAWDVPAIFRFLQKHGNVEQNEMDRVFNMGVGFCLVVRPNFADSIERRLTKQGETVYRLGEIVRGKGEVKYA